MKPLQLPTHCVVCQFPLWASVSLCRDCRDRLPWIGAACEVCGLPLPGFEPVSRCGSCIVNPPPFDRCRALFHYQAPVDGLISRFKFHADFACGKTLASLLAVKLAADGCRTDRTATQHAGPDLLIPVPLHPQRLRSRGFNQALELARVVSRYCGIPLAAQQVKKIRATPPQSELSASDRRHNLNNAYRAEPLPAGSQWGHVVLIDDVVTTGSTASAICRILRQAGVDRIDVWALARAA